MKISEMSNVELILLRNWMSQLYVGGKGYISVSREQLSKLLEKLGQLDTELLSRVLEDQVEKFLDNNFEETLKLVQSGEFDKEK